MSVRLRNDLDLYDRCADYWWDGDSHFAASLHEVNRLRLELILARLGDLQRLTIVDLGCGGGLLSEPLARAGAQVIGVDISAPSLRVAQRHGQDIARLSHVRADALRPPLAPGWADLVLCADLLEHVGDWRRVLASAATMLKPDRGQIFVTTLNRTRRAHLMAVTLGEGLGFVPDGTHDPALFVTPAELRGEADALGLESCGFVGLIPRLIATVRDRRLRLRIGASLAVEYAAWLVRPIRGNRQPSPPGSG